MGEVVRFGLRREVSVSMKGYEKGYFPLLVFEGGKGGNQRAKGKIVLL